MTTFDLDGVVVRDPLKLSQQSLIEIFANRLILPTKIGKFFYLFRQPNKNVFFWIENRKKRGEKIIITSATVETHRELVEKWLKKYQLPYDELLLRKVDEKLIEFKMRLIKETGCRFHLDDNFKVVTGLQKLLRKERVKYRKLGKFFAVMVK